MESIAVIIVAIIEAISLTINTYINKKTNKKVDTITDLKKEIEQSRKEAEERMNKHIFECDKTYLTDFLSEIETGVPKTEIQLKRTKEIYDEYKNLNGNSYIHDKWEELKKKGLTY